MHVGAAVLVIVETAGVTVTVLAGRVVLAYVVGVTCELDRKGQIGTYTQIFLLILLTVTVSAGGVEVVVV